MGFPARLDCLCKRSKKTPSVVFRGFQDFVRQRRHTDSTENLRVDFRIVEPIFLGFVCCALSFCVPRLCEPCSVSPSPPVLDISRTIRTTAPPHGRHGRHGRGTRDELNGSALDPTACVACPRRVGCLARSRVWQKHPLCSKAYRDCRIYNTTHRTSSRSITTGTQTVSGSHRRT